MIFNRIVKNFSDANNCKAFYREIIKKGDLCFDIGANRGKMTDIFLKLGARVISFEPNPKLANKLQRKFPKTKIVRKAVSNVDGKRTLFVNKADVLSTISKKWIDAVKETNRFGELGEMFFDELVVQSVTLPNILRQYGVPEFVKIDTEGHEKDILFTVNDNSIAKISFEFAIPESRNDTVECIKHLVKAGYSYFNISFSESYKFISNKCLNGDGMVVLINSLPHMSWGDIFVFKKYKE